MPPDYLLGYHNQHVKILDFAGMEMNQFLKELEKINQNFYIISPATITFPKKIENTCKIVQNFTTHFTSEDLPKKEKNLLKQLSLIMRACKK